MYISGYGLNSSYYSYLYNSSANTAGLTSDSLNPVSDVLSSKIQSGSATRDIYPPTVTDHESSSDFREIMSLQSKLLQEQEYDRKLEDARVNDPEKYEDMQTQHEKDIAKSFRQVEEIARKSGDGKTGVATYNGVPIVFDFQNSVMTVGDMSNGDIINVGKLSNGYAFSFNRNNIDDISKMLDLFSPEDINKIMAAITTDNIAKSMEQEIEDDKSQAVGGKNGIEFSIYRMNRANHAYEDSFVYAR